jgi:hypothetical protein
MTGWALSIAAALLVSALSAASAGATGTARSSRCPSFIYASKVTINGASCSEATGALRLGRFKAPSNEVFATAGWRCTQTGKRPDAHIRCLKAGAVLTFLA